MFEFLFEIIGEFLLQAVGEALVELGFHSLAEPFRRPPNPWVAALGYALFGAIFGAFSLLVFPSSLVPAAWRFPNLMVTPLAVGGVMVIMGAWRTRRGQPVLRINRFAYGYLFAFALALIRFFFAA
ncbi:hypothetical protein [uncultured Thiodictyon sp.]|uniref:hypothetical protein n=1 Tax=uncultured Thiodictyon sp. TaxID=1846217 RepID=UPI0025F1DBFB|nr:hypothetical protein [uncultured Thiodictyon sp.]